MLTIAVLTTTAQVAEVAPVVTPQDERTEAQRLADASTFGVMIYAFDRAAWVSTDSLTEVVPRDQDRKSTRLNSSHMSESRMPSSA